jgi:hypothetical protein
MKDVTKISSDEMFWLDTYLNETEVLCKNIEEGHLDSYTFKDLFYINKILDHYLNCRDIATPKIHEMFLEGLPSTDLKVAIDYWWQKNVFKRKDTGDELIQECVVRCSNIK